MLCWLATGLLHCRTATADPASQPANPITAPIAALINARLIDGNGGPPISPATLVVENERIVAVGASDHLAIPAGANVVDCAGKTIIPGLISDHSHLGLIDGISTGPGHYTRENVLRQLKQYETYGVTTITSLGINAMLFYDLRREAHAGTLPGSDIFGADRGFGAVNSVPPPSMAGDQVDRPRTPDEARAEVRAAAARHPDLIKLWLDDMNGQMPVKMKPEIYKAIIDESHHQHLRVAGHIYYLGDAKALVRAGVDIIAHGVRNQSVDQEFIDLMKSHDTWYIPTIDLNESFYIYAQRPAWMQDAFFQNALQPALKAQFDDPAWQKKTLAQSMLGLDQNAVLFNQRNLKKLFDAGVRIGFGTDSGATPLRIASFAEHRELQLMVDAGLSPSQAITIATHNAADLLGLHDRGVLAASKLADFLVLDGDPLSDIRNTEKDCRCLAPRANGEWAH
jgi:imidazolonepropionase-like amidohydrolase